MVKENLRQLAKYLVVYKMDLAIVFIALSTVAVSLLSIGYVFRRFIDSGLITGDLEKINNYVYVLIILILIFSVGSFFRSYFINIIADKVVAAIKVETFESLLGVDIVRFEELKIGDLITRLSLDTDQISSLIINFLSFFIRNSIMLSGAVILMFLQSVKLSLLIIISVPISLFPIIKLSRYVRSLSRKTLEERSELSGNIEETFLGIRTLHAYNKQFHRANLFKDKIRLYVKHSGIRLKFRSLFFALAIAVIAGLITFVIWVGSLDIVNGKMSSGQMISFIYYALIVGTSLGGIAELFSEIQGPLSALSRVLELKSISDKSENDKKDLNTNDYSIKFDNVTFSYPARPNIYVLDKLSLIIKQGYFTAIVGRSGSGKSTIMQLILKFYDYNRGSITIGNHDIKGLTAKSIRCKIAYVPQDPMIFSGTIRSNIALSKPEAGLEEIEEIAALCGIDDFALLLPAGLDTEIGERGLRISGGQKQRIAIARSLLYNPEILLLDEATAAIDSEGEKKLLNNIAVKMKGKTIISVAHRVSSIETADNILVIDNGKLVSSGSHDSLIEKSKVYVDLYSQQHKIYK